MVAFLVCGAAFQACAHADLEDQVRSVSEEIAVEPSAALFLKRGGLHTQHEDFRAALADFDRAEDLDPTMAAVWLARGQALFKSGQLPPALSALNRYLATMPRHADAALLRARVLAGLKRYGDAVRDFDLALTLASHPSPDAFLERAATQLAANEPVAALNGLEEGLFRHGNLVTLQSAAIEIEVTLGRYDAALERVDRVLAGLQRRESWLVRRGEILTAAGRHEEARAAFAEAMAAIDRLPLHHREARVMRDLHARLQKKLGS